MGRRRHPRKHWSGRWEQQNPFVYQGTSRLTSAENNLRTKPTQTTRITEGKTQEKAFRINTATYLEKSASWRFESSPVHQSSQSLRPSLLILRIHHCSGNCSG